ncbi:oxalate/formate antiporter family transporter (macronuclear) [Tetrahymena thermophila SB210]|uniref:Oxalate/formate antiporter family transporter n=1 Tax=Tetrahymena thermophila (strain SB210) TaxID=312017 RepID=Q23UB0_TETTS|nr:oxalate/formate antiporter family transporter [Tetrahymena thermophila SB210]EAS00155.1 oxalate/formate antiporter family transporter [Tetrahymena thermophila SB210]|eukprot:XP_001020400.1 oxalate/formate antiporter family transporter [Tetrahymena thermophila SB210]
MVFQLSMKAKGVLTLIGGFILLLMNGSMFLWGQLNVYVTSYYRQKDDANLDLSVGGAIFPVMMASFGIGLPLGIKLVKIFGQARISLLISAIISCLMIVISSYTERFYQFVIVYGIISGLAQGSIYFVPIYIGYLYFPNNRGLVAGINSFGYALNSFLFGLLFFKLVNPNGLPQISNPDGYSYFEGVSISVAQAVPQAIRSIGYIFLSVSIVATQLIMYHPDQIGEQEKRLKKELQKKENEMKELQQIQQKLEQIDIQSIKKNNLQDQEQFQQTDIIQLDQLVVNKKIEIIQLEEEIIQQKIQIAHKIELQKECEYINPQILKKLKLEEIQISENKQNEIFHHQKLVELIILDTPNRKQHKNSILSEVSTKPSDLEKYYDEKENQMEADLQELKKRNAYIEEQLNSLGPPSIKVCFRQPQLYMSILLGFLAVGLGLIINGNYKSIAKDYGFTSDSFQSLVGSLGGVANGFCRPLWSLLLDKYSFKRILQILLLIEIITSLTMQFTNVNRIFYALWVFIIHMTLGGVLGMWPVFCSQINGIKIGSQLYCFYWLGFTIANLFQFMLVMGLKTKIGFNNILYIYFAQALIGLLLMTFYNFKISWAKHYKEIPKNLQSQISLQKQQTLDNQLRSTISS